MPGWGNKLLCDSPPELRLSARPAVGYSLRHPDRSGRDGAV